MSEILGPILTVLALLALSIWGVVWFFRGAGCDCLCPPEDSKPDIPDILRMQMTDDEEPLPPEEEAFLARTGLTDDDLGTI